LVEKSALGRFLKNVEMNNQIFAWIGTQSSMKIPAFASALKVMSTRSTGALLGRTATTQLARLLWMRFFEDFALLKTTDL